LTGKSWAPFIRATGDINGPAVRAGCDFVTVPGVVQWIGLGKGYARARVMQSDHDLTAIALASAFARRTLSPVEVARAALARIEAWEKKINAMHIVDATGAVAQASASEERWRTNTPLSELDGVPVTVKDNIAVQGFPSPGGTAAGDMTPALRDAPPAQRLREAGCVILGKTTMPDFGMLVSGVSSLHGTTRNPWNLARNPGGSSSGAGAGLAAGYAPLALGTDIGGSVRLPASYNGVFALKPSLGRVPIYPPFFGRVAGPMTRTVADAALLMTVLAQPDSRDYMALPYQAIDWRGSLSNGVKGKKLGLLLDIGVGLRPQPAVRDAVEAAARIFEHAGAIVEIVDPFLTPDIAAGVDGFFQARLLAEFQRLSSERQAKALPFIARWCRRAEPLSAVDAARNLALVMLLRERTVAATDPYDFLVSPTSPITAYAADEAAPGNDPLRPFEHIAFTVPFNMSEQPAASICAGFDSDGLPIGLQIAGHRFDDLGVLTMAQAFETMRPPPRAWPEP
jgi:aspartyl-tRNA(Asn)/glutamyl-tRNA(Gln) amidotransferase subunit A